jgi:hypothetical protein
MLFSHFFRGNRTPEFSSHSAYGRLDRSPEHEVSAGLIGLDPSTVAPEGFEWYH